jgi:hypothetical protein
LAEPVPGSGGVPAVVGTPVLNQQINGNNNFQAGGNLTVIQPVNPLISFLQALEYPLEDTAELLAISEELQTYFSDRDVVGLEIKLTTGGREDLLEDAKYEKHRFSKRIAKIQFSLQLRQVYHHILAMLVQRFRNGVLPLINAGAPSSTVDSAVMNIVASVYTCTSAAPKLNLTETDIHAMIYFLTGNCHLKWSK